MNRLSSIAMPKEAKLLDSGIYIVKSILAIAVAYIIGKNLEFVSKDMLSVLFGLMLTIEPLNISGVRNGYQQILSSIIGAATTGIIVSIFGLNIFTISIPIGVTLYICIRLDWRAISPVAFFSAIYMTQYVQSADTLVESMALTFALRIAALSLGVIIAIIFNYLFSYIIYRKVLDKRVILALDIGKKRIYELKKILEDIMNEDKKTGSVILKEKIREFKISINRDLSDIEWMNSYLEDVKREKRIKVSPSNITNEEIDNAEHIIDILREIVFYSNDILQIAEVVDIEKEVHTNLDKIISDFNNLSLAIVTDGLRNIQFEEESVSFKKERIDEDITRIGALTKFIN